MAKLSYDKKYENKLLTFIGYKAQNAIDPELSNHSLPNTVVNLVDIDKYRNAALDFYKGFISNLETYISKCTTDPIDFPRITKKLHKLYAKFKSEKLEYETSGVIDELRTKFESILKAESQYQTNAEIFARKVSQFNLEVAELNLELIINGLTDLKKLAESNKVNLNEKLSNASINKTNSLSKKKKSVDKLSPDCKHKDIIAEVIDNPKYQFKIRSTGSKKNADFQHLKTIHQKLKDTGFINCRPLDFVKVFDGQNPKPIQWLESCTLLFYFIKKMDERFDLCPGNISVYKIAVKYFLDKDNEYFCPHRFSKGDDPNDRDKNVIDRMI